MATATAGRPGRHALLRLGAGGGLALPAYGATISRGAFAPAIADALQALWRLPRLRRTRLWLGSSGRIVRHGRALRRAATIGERRPLGCAAAGPSGTTTGATIRQPTAITATGPVGARAAVAPATLPAITEARTIATARPTVTKSRTVATTRPTITKSRTITTTRRAITQTRPVATGAPVADALAALHLLRAAAELFARLGAVARGGAVAALDAVAHLVVGIGDAMPVAGVV